MLIELFNQLKNEIQEFKYKFLQFNKINLIYIRNFAKQFNNKYINVVIVGVGASSLNIKALTSASVSNIKNVIYLDSLDQIEIESKLDQIEIDKTLFFSISLSGNTHETYLLTHRLLTYNKIIPTNLIIVTPKNSNLLFNLYKEFKTLYFEYQNVESGRFGIISEATLLPAYVIGIDIDKIVVKSLQMLCKICESDNPGIIEDVKWYIDNLENNKNILVLFNYSFQLQGLCLWMQQILAESLGKENFGVTPIIAKGTLDQHSQLQLYLDGPDNKFYQILLIKSEGISQQNEVHANNIFAALINKKRNVKLKLFENFDEAKLVEQIIETILIVILIARKQKLNPFDQPAVDFYKKNNLFKI